MKAKPAKDSGFLEDPARLEKRGNFFPYGRYWCDWQGLTGYSRITVAPVSTAHLLERSSWQKFNTTKWSGYENDVKGIADHLKEAFEKAIGEDTDKRFTVSEEPGEKGLYLSHWV